MVTEKPRACNKLASEAAMMPLPNEEVTPPVTKIYLTLDMRMLKCATKVGFYPLLWKKFRFFGFRFSVLG